MALDVQAAETTLEELLERVEAGEEVVISRGDKVVATVVPAPAKKPFPFDKYAHMVEGDTSHYADPTSEEELREWGV